MKVKSVADVYCSYLDDIERLEKENKILRHKIEKAKRALCDVHRLSLSDETDISRCYDIVHPVIIELNGV